MYFTPSPSSPRMVQMPFDNIAALRQAVMSVEDEYSAYEQSILAEVNELRRDPALYSHVVEAQAAVGFPYVRDDADPSQCSEMTLEQLRVYIQDFQRERAELEETLRRHRREWSAAEASLRERWSQEDIERQRRAKRATGSRKGRPMSSVREEDFATDRQRAAQEMHNQFTHQQQKTEAKLKEVQSACQWAIEGANVIVMCVRQLRRAVAVPWLEYSRSLSLAARDVGHASHRQTNPNAKTTTATSTGAPQGSLGTHAKASGNDHTIASILPSTSQLLPAAPIPTHNGEDRLLDDVKDSLGSSVHEVSHSKNLNHTQSMAHHSNSSANGLEWSSGRLSSSATSYPDAASLMSDMSPLPLPIPSADVAAESRRLRQATAQLYGRYGYCVGQLRGLQLCGAHSPRRTVVQMLLGLRVPHFAVIPSAAEAVGEEASTTQPVRTGRHRRSPLLWRRGRLLGSGWVRTPDGAVSVTILIAASFEELRLIRDRHDFSLPQIHRILNSPSQGQGYERGAARPAVVLIQSKLGVRVLEPPAHPLFVPSTQRVVRIAAFADPDRVQLAAHVTPVVHAATQTISAAPTAPLADSELLLVQRSRESLSVVEILLDARAAWRRWPSQPLLVHLFERERPDGAFTNLGFVRLTPDAAARPPTPPLRPPAGRMAAVEVRAAPLGWPTLTSAFDASRATLLAPLEGVWAAGRPVRVGVRLPAISPRPPPPLQCAAGGEGAALSARLGAARAALAALSAEVAARRPVVEQELQQARRAQHRRKGRELARLRRAEEDAVRRLDAMGAELAGCAAAVAAAERDVAQCRREEALRAARRRWVEAEEERRRAEAEGTRRVEAMLVGEDGAVWRTALRPLQAEEEGGKEREGEYEAVVHVPQGFRGRAVLLVNEQEAVRWVVRPEY